jgi:hypothetical protein
MARLDPGQHLVHGHRECRDLVAALRDRDLLDEVEALISATRERISSTDLIERRNRS